MADQWSWAERFAPASVEWLHLINLFFVGGMIMARILYGGGKQ